METFEQYDLIYKRKWTPLLRGLDEGVFKFKFQSVEDIHSFKSIAYKLNTDRIGRRYSIDADKEQLLVTITVKNV